MISFYIGQKVVCIDATDPDPSDDTSTMDGLTKGQIYTIRWIGITSCDMVYSGGITVRLQEIVRPTYGWPDEPGFRPSRFRPVVATDISALTALLAPSDALGRDLEEVLA